MEENKNMLNGSIIEEIKEETAKKKTQQIRKMWLIVQRTETIKKQQQKSSQ